MRGDAELVGVGARGARAREAVFVGSAHIRAVLEEVVGHVDRVHEVPPGVDVDEFVPSRATRRSPACSRRRARDPPNPGNANERLPDEGNAERLAAFFARRRADRPLLRQAASTTRASTLLLEALQRARRARVIVGFGDYRAELEALAPARTLFTGAARAPASRPPAAARRRRRRAVDLPGGVRHGRRRGGRGGRAAARRAPLGARGGRRGARGGVPAERAPLAASRPATSAELARQLHALLALPPSDREALGARRPHGRSSAGLGGVAERLLAACQRRLRRWATSRSSRLDEQLRSAREAFEAGTDFTVAVEEEFALLDPETLELVNRFEDLQAAAQGTALEPSTSSAS